MMDFVGRAKWDAWNRLGSISQVTHLGAHLTSRFFILLFSFKEEAQKEYIDFVTSLAGSQSVEASPASATSKGSGAFENIIYEEKDNVSVVKFNRPKRKNAFTTKVSQYMTCDIFLYSTNISFC